MPLSLAELGEAYIIKRIGGTPLPLPEDAKT